MQTFTLDDTLPIKCWATDIDEKCMEQAENLAKLPFAFKHIALMPDTHMGYGMPIGGVLACKEVVIPNAVGVDIGCGMCSVETRLTDWDDTERLKKAMQIIRQTIPTGFKKHSKPRHVSLMPEHDPFQFVVNRELEKARLSLGTLGGGNHFIELQKDAKGFIWVMIHSGSRNLGLQVAKHYNDLAIKLNARWFSEVPKENELAFLPMVTSEAANYASEMKYCVDFALANRTAMMEATLSALAEAFGDYENGEMLNIAHNYAAKENHYGHNVIVHRKGATRARDGELGIIPGSQGTSSYIVKGLGNRESFNSCSHGAGRKMGRKQAIRELSLEHEQRRLDGSGIIHSVRHAKDLDEAPGAYKSIDMVMNNQLDLVEIVTKLTPLAVVKG